MLITSQFESSAVVREEMLGNIAKLLDHQAAEIRSTEDIVGRTYELTIKVPITKEVKSTVITLTGLSVKAATGQK